MTVPWGELRRFARFLIVGGGLFAVDFAVFVGLIEVGASVPVAQLISVSIRTVIGFAAHKWFTFRGDTSDALNTTAKQGMAYLLQGVVNAPVSVAVVAGCVWLLDGWAVGGKVLAEAVMVVEVYVLYRLVVYSNRWFGRPTSP